VSPAGVIDVALGLEYRTERAKSVFDELSASGATFQNAIRPFLPPDLTVKEAFAELRVPLLRDRRLAKELALEMAGRISDYNTAAGSVSAYHVGLVYAPLPDLRFRANISTSVRAPTQADLYRPLSQDFAFLADPCDLQYIQDNPNRAANCAEDGVPSGFVNDIANAQSIGFQMGGNPMLVEEEGESLTIGAIYQPRFLAGLSISIDYYEIEVTDMISPPDAQAILNACYDSPSGVEDNPFCEAVNPRTPRGYFGPVALVATGFNYARQVTEGVDLELRYGAELRNRHALSARLLATRIFELNNHLDPQNPYFADRVLGELGDPELAFNLDLAYSIGNLDLSYGLRCVDGQTIGLYEEQHAFNGIPPTDADIYPRKRYPSAAIHAIRAEYALRGNLTVFGGVDNLTDSLPPLGLLGDAPGEPYDSIGRYFYMGMTLAL
jgi:outer membrane receptor protein involved in Fe transport